MGINLSPLGFMDKLDDIIYKPVEVLSEWLKEPIIAREHKRQMETKKLDAELEIKRGTEINRINAEIDEWMKDKHLERMEKVAEATSRYQMQLTNINTDAIRVIGNMQLELRDKAQEMIIDKTAKYKEIQKQAMEEAYEDFSKLEERFSSNEAVKNIMYKHIDNRLANIINSADNFLKELIGDLNNLNQDISKLTEFGQKSVEKLMDRFRDIGTPNELPNQMDTKRIE